LGIVALIAVAIILLCMWGGGRSSKEVATTDEQAQSVGGTDAEPAAADLAQELAYADSPAPAGRQVTGADETSVTVGGQTPATRGVTEEAAINKTIEEKLPEQIPLEPQKDSLAPRVASAAASEPVAALQTHVVQRGETLDKISLKYYGTRHKWQVILDSNKSVVSDPKQLRPGMKLIIPALPKAAVTGVAVAGVVPPTLSALAEVPASGAAAVKASPAPSGQRTYTVQKNDNLIRIARKFYNDGSRWKDIQAANPGKASDLRALRPGAVLVIP
jgi:nucleoid-associated protein YgaU